MQAKNYPFEEIDVRQLLTALWQKKITIACIGMVGVMFGIVASALSTRYVTEGLFLTPGMPLENYKTYVSFFSNSSRLQKYLNISGQADSVGGIFLNERVDSIGQIINPEFVFSEADKNNFGVKIASENSGTIIGLRIEVFHDKPMGGAAVGLLGEYMRDSIIRVDLEGMMLSLCDGLRSREQSLRNAKIQNDFAIQQEESRLVSLRSILARNPDALTSGDRQVFSLEKGAERFLSPTTQIVAAEVYIADMKLQDIKREREKISSAIKRDYYCQAKDVLQLPVMGGTFLAKLKDIQVAVFHGYDKSIDIVEQTWNELDVERERWLANYLSRMRFVASPEGAETIHRKFGYLLGGILGGLLGVVSGLLLALVLVWWQGFASGGR